MCNMLYFRRSNKALYLKPLNQEYINIIYLFGPSKPRHGQVIQHNGPFSCMIWTLHSSEVQKRNWIWEVIYSNMRIYRIGEEIVLHSSHMSKEVNFIHKMMPQVWALRNPNLKWSQWNFNKREEGARVLWPTPLQMRAAHLGKCVHE